jgi:hypothetical protein
MSASKSDALREIAKRICGCYGSVDLNFALHPSDEATAKSLKNLAKEMSLTAAKIEYSIKTVIKNWLETKYYGFGDNKPRSYGNDEATRTAKVFSMVSEATRYFTT